MTAGHTGVGSARDNLTQLPAVEKTESRRHTSALLGLTLVSTFVLYAGTATFGFVYDDVLQVLGNPAIRSWGHVGEYFTRPVISTPYYRPFFTLWLRLNYALFGTHAAGWHIASVLLHVVATALVFYAARRITRSANLGLVTALIFGVHPVHVESVAWISDACDPLYSIFFLGSFLAYGKSGEQNTAKWKSVSVLFCALSLLSKESAATFPAVIWLYEYIFGQGPRIKRAVQGLRASSMFFVVVLAYLAVRTAVMSGPVESLRSVSVTTAIFTIPRVTSFYISKLFWPVGLSAFYNPIYVERLSVATMLVPALVVVALSVALWVWIRRDRDGRYIAFGALWFLLVLAPVLYVRLFPYGEAAHDRYLYLPLAGFGLVAALGLSRLTLRFGWPASRFAIVAVLIALPLGAITLSQQVFWASDILLYRRGVATAPTNSTARSNLGRALADAGRYDEAEVLLSNLARTDPGNWQAHYNLGYVYYRTHRFAAAEPELTSAVAIYAGYADVHVYLGLTEFQLGKPEIAERELREAIALAPDRPGSHLALSFVLQGEGKLRDALVEAEEELKHSADNPQTRAYREQLAREAWGKKEGK